MNARTTLFPVVVGGLALLALSCQENEEEPPPAPTDPGNTVNPWIEDGTFGTGVMNTADNFTMETTDGTWKLRDHWNGEDSYIILQRYRTTGGTQQMWTSSVADLLAESPDNVHYFFVSARDDWEADRDDIDNRIQQALDDLDDDAAAHWAERLHVADEGVNDLGGWDEDVLEGWPNTQWGASASGYAIDRFQRLRELGLMRWPGSSGATTEMLYAAYEAQYYNFEYERELWIRGLGEQDDLVLWDAFPKSNGSVYVEVELPSSDAMQGYDNLVVDLTMGCVDSMDVNCFEWDYKAHMSLCEVALEDTTAPPKTCTPQELDAEGNLLVAADTTVCQCTSPYDGLRESTRTCVESTDKEGVTTAGWSDCNCSCGPEIARWITTYHRWGRWVTDITPSMAHLGEGGPARVKFDTSYPYELSASLHFSNQGHGVRPSTVVPLWGGGGFNADYNASHPPITFEVPEGTQRAEVVAFITGHGFNNDSANCAEFCNHEHHFQANGGTVHTDSHPEADNIVGCVEQIEDGTVPNQFGTWPFGRGGWCPGLDVPPWRADLTEDLIEGTNTITYEASLAGNPPDNAGSIWMTSYLVFYR